MANMSEPQKKLKFLKVCLQTYKLEGIKKQCKEIKCIFFFRFSFLETNFMFSAR